MGGVPVGRRVAESGGPRASPSTHLSTDSTNTQRLDVDPGNKGFGVADFEPSQQRALQRTGERSDPSRPFHLTPGPTEGQGFWTEHPARRNAQWPTEAAGRSVKAQGQAWVRVLRAAWQARVARWASPPGTRTGPPTKLQGAG